MNTEKSGDAIRHEEKALTPLMQQYKDLKAQNPNALLLFRCGDFYETFFEDAVVAARELQITLTARGKSGDNPVPLAGVPYHSAFAYINKLVQKGFSVAICEQMEDPRLAKGLVKREIVKIITPGTIADPQMLDDSANNYLLALGLRKDRFCLVAVELSTGEILTSTGDSSSIHLLPDELAGFDPREILLLQGSDETADTSELFKNLKAEIHARKISSTDAVDALSSLYPREHSSKFLNLNDLELRTLGIAADYLLDTQKCSLDHLQQPRAFALGDDMILDEAALRNLELLPESRERGNRGNLFSVINRTCTSAGARLLKRWLVKPLTRKESILKRQEHVAAFVDQPLLLEQTRGILKQLPDFERLVSKTILGSRNPRDLRALGDGLAKLPKFSELSYPESLAILIAEIPNLTQLSELLAAKLNDDLPANLSDGGVIASGTDPELDELRALMQDGNRWVQEFELQERERTGIKTLKVRRNSVFGFFIEISKSLAEKAPDHYIRKQTLVNGERFITAELKDYETRVFSATEKSVAIEKRLFEGLVDRVRDDIQPVQKVSALIGYLDVTASLAKLALEFNYTRPEICDEPATEIEGGRHPVVESYLESGSFQSNDTFLGSGKMQAIITGPNMAGKSTYLRQVALITLLAQIGSYVPARRAKMGIVDRIFTRVGASDNLAGGQSTFMVEMTETAAILKNAGPKSLLILDEIGRGTSTFDGLALAWAIIEHIGRFIHARTLFATHYHELTDLASVHDSMFNLNVGVFHDEQTGAMVFQHKILDGPSSKSYGIEVAALAGVPSPVTDRAREILFELEKTEQEEVGRVTRSVSPAVNRQPVQQMLFAPTNALSEAVKSLDVNSITPLEALNLLAKLKDMADG